MGKGRSKFFSIRFVYNIKCAVESGISVFYRICVVLASFDDLCDDVSKLILSMRHIRLVCTRDNSQHCSGMYELSTDMCVSLDASKGLRHCSEASEDYVDKRI